MSKEIVPIVLKKSGNTKQISPSKHWVFTLNNYTKFDINLIVENRSIKKYSFQEEIGESGTPHLQGYLEFITKRRPLSQFKNLGAHWEKCKHVYQAICYTQKEDTRAGKLYLKGLKKIRPIKVLARDDLYDWQEEIVCISHTIPCDRLIHWFWEPKGCKGKTQLCKYLAVMQDAIMIGGTKADMFFQVSSCKFPPDIIMLNLSNGSGMPDVKALEAIKDGIFASPKYESKMFIMNSPHIFVFSNFEPYFGEGEYDNSKRWIVRKL